MAFFSIIIPVYNTQEYIARCLDSCINQTFSDIEIIVIDDCGMDLAMDIVKKYAQQDKRIQIIQNPKNLGLFHTRIVGEKQAKGEYIIHLDSDDFIHQDLCSKLFLHISDNKNNEGGGDIDILSFGSQIFPTPNTLKTFFISPYLKKYTIDNMLSFFSCGWNIWGRTYHRKIVEQTNNYIEENLSKLPKINMAEDALKLFIIMMFAKTHSYIAEYLHFYFQNPDSITKEISYHRILKNIDDYTSVVNALEKIDLNVLSASRDFADLREQIITYCKLMISHYSILNIRQSYQEGLLCYCSTFRKNLKYIKGKKQLIIYCVKFCLTFFTFGKIKI